MTGDSNKILVNDLKYVGASERDIQRIMNNPNKFILRSIDGSQQGRNRSRIIRKVILASYTKGFRVIFILGAALAVFAFLVAFFLIPQVELVRSDDAQLKEDGRARDRELREQNNRMPSAISSGENSPV